MRKTIGGSILTISVVIVLFFAFGTLPDETVNSPTSAINNAKKELATDVVIDAGGQAIKQTGELAIDSACKNGASQGCSTTTTSVTLIGITFTIMIYGLIIAGIIGVIMFIAKAIRSLI